MSILKFSKNKNKNKKEKNYYNPDAIKNVILYILNPDKITHGIIGAIGLDCSENPKEIIRCMQSLQKYFRKDSGKRLHHFIVSFSDKEMEMLKLKDYLLIGYEITDYFKGEYQIVFSLHENEKHLHIHFVLNPVNVYTGKKYRWKKYSYDFKQWVKEVTLNFTHIMY